ncbi:tetratricopeptide repeat protein [Pedobacter duraquae]|uniref:Tetratricopeptide repeat protein n=1 Tax=Pedobacter duraquae TaxID=425511 RepID=A0A4R6IPN7_9SPHI|nr:hypothetical protein [Pedobacter duraquae]TDO24233.1 tetratricopeptide repeat protein [Pedobacter duraquae]
MKLKYPVVSSILLLIFFITAQSFYSGYVRKKPTVNVAYSFKGFNRVAAFCAPMYEDDDTAANIPLLTGWGNYKFKITTKSDSAQIYFNQGLSMYYSFHTIEAIASFTKATHLDPSSAMAWYGKSLAMGPTINYPNGYVPPKGAYEASIKAKLLKGNATPVEQALITAMEQRYSSDTTVSVKQLRTNYANAMHAVYTKYPDNVDVMTLYADALMLLHPWDLYAHDFTPRPWTPEIRSLLEKAIAISSKHPGANHYYIHTMEPSATPQLANGSAHLLDTLMPLVSHITHMPSHIYLRTGDFERGIKDNDVAIAGFNIYQKQYAPVMNGFGLYVAHNMHLKLACAQMAGAYGTASTTADKLKKSIPADYLGMKGADGNFVQSIYMEPAITAIRFGKWDDAIKAKPVDSLPYASLLAHFARGIAWSAKGDAAKARQELKLLDTKMRDTSLRARMDNFSTALESATVARLILLGVIADREKQYASAIAFLRKAVDTEDKITYGEPRDWPLPARQYLGQTLLKAGKNDEAIAVFKQDLVINPNNGWALNGLLQAYQSTGKTTALAATQLSLKNAWKLKDLPITTSVF